MPSLSCRQERQSSSAFCRNAALREETCHSEHGTALDCCFTPCEQYWWQNYRGKYFLMTLFVFRSFNYSFHAVLSTNIMNGKRHGKQYYNVITVNIQVSRSRLIMNYTSCYSYPVQVVFQVQVLRLFSTTAHSSFYSRTCLGYVL